MLPELPSLPVPVWQDSTRGWGISCIPTLLLPAAPRRSEGHCGSWLRPRLASSSSADGSEQGNSPWRLLRVWVHLFLSLF